MKRLIAMRHAKSDWGHRGLDDHDRPLNQRGRLAARLMGAYLSEIGAVPDLALVSSALRTQETWRLMGLDVTAETRKALYLADASTLAQAMREAPDAAETLLLLAHQPGMQDFANRYLPEWAVDDYPTAKLAIIEFDVNHWREAGFGAGRLIAEASPKTLV